MKKNILLFVILLISSVTFAQPYILVRWVDGNDKDITDKTKFNLVGENIAEPSLSGLVNTLEYFKLRSNVDINADLDPLIAYAVASKTLTEETVTVVGADNLDYQIRQYDVSYEVILRPDADLIETIEEFEINSNNEVFPYYKQFKYVLFYAMANKRVANGGTLTAYQQAIVDRVETKGLKMWQNWMTSIAKQNAVVTGDPLQISEGWETIDPEENE